MLSTPAEKAACNISATTNKTIKLFFLKKAIIFYFSIYFSLQKKTTEKLANSNQANQHNSENSSLSVDAAGDSKPTRQVIKSYFAKNTPNKN